MRAPLAFAARTLLGSRSPAAAPRPPVPGLGAPFSRPPFAVLWRAFVQQFFTSDAVSSDVQLRQTIIWVLAFLITPGFMLVIQVMPMYEIAVAVAAKRGTPEIVEQILRVLGAFLVTYSMVTTGFIAVFVWDGLAFDRRDAMVLGPLPLGGPTVIAAKLAALGALLLGASTIVNLITAVPFAFMTANHEPLRVLVRNFLTHLAATVGAATFVFCAIVTVRGIVGLAAGPRLTVLLGTLLQCGFVAALLMVMILIPQLSPAAPRLLEAADYRWVPLAWFLGLFERGLELSRAPFGHLAVRALAATPLAVAGAVLVSIAGYRRQMRLALAPAASPGPLASARLTRALARLIVGRDQPARATSDFILLTLARNRAQQAPVAMNAAVAVAVAAAALSTTLDDPVSLLRPRTVVLWIPLLVAYWTMVGMRASFFVPSELPAAWSFRSHGPEPAVAYWSAVRASVIAAVAPGTMGASLVLAPLVGWRVAAWHALLAGALSVLLAEIVALTIRHVPFTRPYQPGHARLKLRWPIYLIGMYGMAYWPVQIELRLLGDPASMLKLVGAIGAGAAIVDVVGRRVARRWSLEPPPELDEEYSEVTALDIGSIVPSPGASR
jgi:hypothetical protein